MNYETVHTAVWLMQHHPAVTLVSAAVLVVVTTILSQRANRAR